MINQSMIARILTCIILLSGFTLFTSDIAYAQWGGGPGCDISNPDGDNDGDGMTNGEEQQNGTNPCNPDSDNDDMPDQEEDAQSTNPLVADTDGDGLTDGQEFNQIGTSPVLSDTDADGLLDGQEVSMGFDALNDDMDFDGLKDGEEVQLGTNARSAHSDEDEVSDFDEVMLGTNPTVTDSPATFQAACNALGSENGMVVCNAYNTGDSGPVLNKDTGAQGTQVQGCASAGANSSGMPSYFILFALMIMANIGLRQRKKA
ncbi:MAG TPA: hypothetical protein PKC21_01475 [Oligoflexia bacterium]|nr:hypothetical protein [Oligoflexia bacterium]HMR24001.1 hypothetical protein [Oligoflexia bacterium]